MGYDLKNIPDNQGTGHWNASDQAKKILTLIPCSHSDLEPFCEMLSALFFGIELHMNIYKIAV